MILTISTLELSVVAAAVASISIVAIGVNAAPDALERIEALSQEEELNLETLELND